MHADNYLESPGDYTRIATHRDAIIDAMEAVLRYSECTTTEGRAAMEEEITCHGLTIHHGEIKDTIYALEMPIYSLQPPADSKSHAPGLDSIFGISNSGLNQRQEIERFKNVSDWSNPDAVAMLVTSEMGHILLAHVARLAWVIDLTKRELSETQVEGYYPHLYIDRYSLRRMTQQKLVGLTLEQQIRNFSDIMKAPAGISVRKSAVIGLTRDRIFSADEVINPDAKHAQRVSMKADGKIEISRPLPPSALAGLIGHKVEDVIEGPVFENTDIVITDAEIGNSGTRHVTFLTTDNCDFDKLVKIER